MSDVYPYSTGERLDDRNTYQYTPDWGSAFLPAWAEDRRRALASLPERAERFLLVGKEAAVTPDGSVPTTDLLAAIEVAIRFSEDAPIDAVLASLDRLMQRFEVTKRLHRVYTAAYRPADPADFRTMRPYLALASALDAAYLRTGHLSYLNAQLKINDTLVALRDRLSPSEGASLAQSLWNERLSIRRLARELHIPFPA